MSGPAGPLRRATLPVDDSIFFRLVRVVNLTARPFSESIGKAYHLSVHRLEDEQRFHMALEEGGKIVDVCRTEKKPRKRG